MIAHSQVSELVQASAARGTDLSRQLSRKLARPIVSWHPPSGPTRGGSAARDRAGFLTSEPRALPPLCLRAGEVPLQILNETGVI